MNGPDSQGNVSREPSGSQRQRVCAYLAAHGMARLSELKTTGATAATVSRLVRDGTVLRLSRGLYQLAGADLQVNHSLAEVAKRVPNGVICLVSAMAFHGLIDDMPPRVWVAIGQKDWAPRVEYPPLRLVRLSDARLRADVEAHIVEGVKVPVFGVARSVVDLFRRPGLTGRDVAIESLKAALRRRKTNLGEISRIAVRDGAWEKMRPYLEMASTVG